MEGLDEVIHGNLERQLPEILQALDNCGASQEADVLRQASAMTLEEYEGKYDSLCDKLAINNDYLLNHFQKAPLDTLIFIKSTLIENFFSM